MGLAILTVVAILVLLIVVFRRAPDKVTVSNTRAKWLMRIALVLMGLYVVFWLFFGIGEMISGDLSGAFHLVPAIMVVVLMFLAWRRPKEGGVIIVVLGLLVSLYYAFATMQGGRSFDVTSLIGGVPFLVSGLLLLGAVALARRK